MAPERDPIIDRKAPQRPARAGCLSALALGISLAIFTGAVTAWILDWRTGLVVGVVVLVLATLLDAFRRRRGPRDGAP